jgi:hypothetical protein
MSSEPPLPPSPLDLGLEALREGRSGDALHCFEQAYHLNPHDYRLHEACGELYFDQGDLRRAREYLVYATHLAPTAPGPRYRLALVALQEGRTGEGMQLLQSVLALDPDNEEAKRALAAEEDRRRIAARLPAWQAERAFGEEALLRPPRQVGPDGKDRPAPLRAPYHCVNCYFRPGQTTERAYAYRYQWWNMGLVGLVFGGWPVYLLWTLAARERRFRLEPLYCSVCNSQRRTLAAVFWVLVVLGTIFALVGVVLISVWQAQPASDGLFIFAIATLVVALACGGFSVWAFRAGASQRGLRMRVVSDAEVGVSFYSRQYAEAFRELNSAFIVSRPGADTRAEAESFVPTEGEHSEDGVAASEAPPAAAAPPQEQHG